MKNTVYLLLLWPRNSLLLWPWSFRTIQTGSLDECAYWLERREGVWGREDVPIIPPPGPGGDPPLAQHTNFGPEMGSPPKSGEVAQNAKMVEFHENDGISPNLVKFSHFSTFPQKWSPKWPIFLGRQAPFHPGAPFSPNLVKFSKNGGISSILVKFSKID